MNLSLDLAVVTNWLKRMGTPYPARDWLVAVTTGALIVLAGIGIAAYLFLGVRTGTLIEAGTPRGTPPEPVPRQEMSRVLERYGIRLVNYDSANVPTFDIFDPHLNLGAKKK
ncbi:MAG: hypothetical protein AAB955_03135 [Patescibacteria group bacterium]